MFKTIRNILFLTLMPLLSHAQPIAQETMQRIYDEVKTPYKYGMVMPPADANHQIDCPTVWREGDKWIMTYVQYNSADGLSGRGYETWQAESTDLLHWETKGRVLSYVDHERWDMNQRGGFPSLIDWTWDGPATQMTYKGCRWMTYIGGHGTGYEAVKEPLNIGLAWTKNSVSEAHEWQTMDRPLLSINDKDVQWWDSLVQYKSTVYYDEARTLGKRFVMYYNAGGINPTNGMKAERIGIALSNDLKKWKRYSGNPIYAHEEPGIITGDAQIVRMDSLYVMFYFSAYNPTRPYSAFNTFSVSRDLLHWQDWTGADLVWPTKTYDDLFAHKSYVLKHEGVVYHFYCAVNRAGQRGIAVATSVPMGRSDKAFVQVQKKGKRTTTALNDSWLVTWGETTENAITQKEQPFYVNIPNNLDDYYGYRQLKHGNLHGSATYSKTFNTTKSPAKRYFLELQGVGTYATVTLNGHQYPRELIGRVTHTFDVTDHLCDGDNTITILTEHPSHNMEAPWVCGGCSSEWGFSEGTQPFGLYRPVLLHETDEVRIEPYGVHIWNNIACDSVYIETEIRNYSTAEATFEVVNKMNLASGKTYFRLSDNITLAAGEQRVVRQSVAVSDAHLWSTDDPYLYSLVTMIKRSGRTADEITTPYGIRSISWPKNSQREGDHTFRLNGKSVFINGTCDYEHLFGNSHAWQPEQVAARMRLMRLAGFNAFREAHQPHNLEYQRLLDQDGMLFWSQFSAHIWYDTPQFREQFKRLLRQYIKERRNSPSLILWGLQNESVLPKEFAEECTQIIREMDPTASSQRLVTTCNGGEGTDWNVVQNWSGTYGGDATQYGEELKRPEQLLNGEYGAWRTVGLHTTDSVMGSKTYSEESFIKLLQTKAQLAFANRDSVCGHFQWPFVSHENPGRVQPDESIRRVDKVGPFNHKGILTSWEQPTCAYPMYRTFSGQPLMTSPIPTAADRNVDLLKGADGWNYIYRVNCGGDAVTDEFGQQWQADDSIVSHSWAERFGLQPFMASQGHITHAIHGTNTPQLFQYFRWGRQRLTYTFPVSDGRYRVEFYTLEPWLLPDMPSDTDLEGLRIMNIAVNDSIVCPRVDPWAEGGFAGAVKHVAEVDVRGGMLRVTFPDCPAGEAVIAAIAVASTTTATAPGSIAKVMQDGYWKALDADTIAVLPKSDLPEQQQLYPVAVYPHEGNGRFIITPGLGKE